MPEQFFQVVRADRVATVLIDREPKRNAFKQVMWDQLGAIVGDLAADPEVFVIVLRGAGRQAFSAGADIAEFDASVPDEAEIRRRNASVDGCLAAIERCPKAVIAMIYGYAMGGGCSLALACDLRMAAESAKFGIPAAR
ncbi:MAG TPA: enoyl-CoA hydratase/isomerase family protein, partial [Dehalococcoidia bacterium]|nr:enoyl-CoA hydratase/isomerase family protein [Dehalococcoidia bacterium]